MHQKKTILLILLALVLVLAIWRPWKGQEFLRLGLTARAISPMAILPFDTSLVEEDWRWLDTGLVDMFATKLNHLPSLRAVSLERLLEKVTPPTLRSGIRISPQEAIAYFQAQTVLAGKLSTLEKGFRLEIRLLGKGGKTVLLREHFDARDFQALHQAVDSLSVGLVNSLDWETPPQVPPIARITTGSLPAYHHYVMAVEDYIISDDSSLPRAADHLQLASAADSTFARSHFLRAKVADQAQALDIPLEFPEESLDQALRFPGRLPEWERQYALGWRLWLVEGDLEGAVTVLRQLAESHRDYAWQEGVPLTLGRLLAHQGRWPEAIDQLTAYVRADETPALRRVLGWGQLATALQLTGNLSGAIEAVERELSLYSNHQGNRYWWIGENMTLALLYFERGEAKALEEILGRVENVAAGDPRGLAMIGLTRYGMQQVNRADALAEKALRLDSDLASAHYLRGLLALRRKHYWSAVADLEAACTQEFDWDYLYHAALAHAGRGDRQSAHQLLDVLAQFLGGEALEAVEPVDLGTLGILLSRLDRNEEALTYGLAAAQQFPYPQAKYDLASIYAIQGDRANAMKWLRAAFADGYVNQRQARADFNLENLWYDPDFILMTSGR